MSKEEFIKGLKFLLVAYNKEFTQEQAEVWYKFFKDEDFELYRTAIKNLISKEEYLPSIAKVRNEIAKLKTSEIPSAEDEWNEVLNTIRKFGSYRQKEALENLKPYTAYIVKNIGYLNICRAEEQTWNKKEFVGEYNALKDREVEMLQIGTNNLKMLGVSKELIRNGIR